MDFSIVGKQKGAEFYINYEECKFFKVQYNFNIKNGFILTMRNVNEIERIKEQGYKLVLY